MTPEVSYRGALAREAGAIRRLVLRTGINPRDLDWHRFLVAIDGEGRVIGCGQVKPHGDGSRELASIAVRPRWRMRGVASEVIRRLMAQSGPPLWLMCRPNLAGFYDRFGFVRVRDPERMPRYFRRVYRLATAAARLISGEHPMAVMVWGLGNGEVVGDEVAGR
jgi:N-acetylglutamate synthase-like GNAT family acetyltransferase